VSYGNIPFFAVVKRANSRRRDRRDSISSMKPVLTYATPLEIPLTEPEATGDAGKQVGGSHPDSRRISQLAICSDSMARMD